MKPTRSKAAVSIAVLTVILGCFATGSHAQQFVMKIGLANPAQEFSTAYTPYLVFAHEVELRSNGRIKAELYPAGQLGNVESLLNQLRSGIIQASAFAEGHYTTFYPTVQIFSIPYLFAEREIAWEVLDGPFGMKVIEDMATKTGLRVLSWEENGGFRHFSNSKKEIKSPGDMKGLKIRTMNIPLHMEIVKNLGASPTPVSWSEIYTALQTGVVDGQENAISSFMIPKLEEVQKFMVLDGHVYSIKSIVLNEKWYKSLPNDLKAVIQRANIIATQVSRGLSAAREVMGIEYLKEKGVKIYKPTAEEKNEFRKLTRDASVQWLKKELNTELVDELMGAVEKAEKKFAN